MGGFNSGKRAATPDTDDCIRFSLADLRRDGAVRRHQMSRRERHWQLDGDPIASLTIVIDCLESRPCLRITGMAFGQSIDQRLPLVPQPQPFGGERFYILCPITARRCTTLFLPPGRVAFASARGWGVPYASTREREVDRALRNIYRLEKRLANMSKYTRRRTREQIAERRFRACDVVDAHEKRLIR